jgi:transcriptional regulator with XRE-family HTH domain
MLNYNPEKIKSLREGRGWNQSELARAAKLSANTIWHLERGLIRMVKHQTLVSVASALGVPVQAILSANQPADIDAQLQSAIQSLSGPNKAAMLAAAKALLDSQKPS